MCANTLLYIHQRLEGFCSRPDMYLDINEVDSGNNSREMDPLRNAEKNYITQCPFIMLFKKLSKLGKDMS